MKVKILFFPLAMSVSLAVVVFSAKPEFDDVLKSRAMVTQKKTIAEKVRLKVQNAHDLEANLNSNKESEDIIGRYFPNKRDDDRVVDTINFLTTQSGLALSSVKITKITEEVPTPDPLMQDPAAQGSSSIFATSEAEMSVADAAPVITANPKIVSVSVEAEGSYESIRDAVGKLSHADRFQDFKEVNISKVTDESSSTNANALKASFMIKFAYLPPVNARGNFNLPLLDQNKFSFDVVENLKRHISTAVPPMTVTASGTNNPFLR